MISSNCTCHIICSEQIILNLSSLKLFQHWVKQAGQSSSVIHLHPLIKMLIVFPPPQCGWNWWWRPINLPHVQGNLSDHDKVMETSSHRKDSQCSIILIPSFWSHQSRDEMWYSDGWRWEKYCGNVLQMCKARWGNKDVRNEEKPALKASQCHHCTLKEVFQISYSPIFKLLVKSLESLATFAQPYT